MKIMKIFVVSRSISLSECDKVSNWPAWALGRPIQQATHTLLLPVALRSFIMSEHFVFPVSARTVPPLFPPERSTARTKTGIVNA